MKLSFKVFLWFEVEKREQMLMAHRSDLKYNKGKYIFFFVCKI